MFARLIASGTASIVNPEGYCFSGMAPVSSCISNGGLPTSGSCKSGLLPAVGAICELGGTPW